MARYQDRLKFNLTIDGCRSATFKDMEAADFVDSVVTCAASIHDLCLGDENWRTKRAGGLFTNAVLDHLNQSDDPLGICMGCALRAAPPLDPRATVFRPLCKDHTSGAYYKCSADQPPPTAQLPQRSPPVLAPDPAGSSALSPQPPRAAGDATSTLPAAATPAQSAPQTATPARPAVTATSTPPSARPTAAPTAVPTAAPTPPPTPATPSVAAAVTITSATCRYLRSTGSSDWVNEVTVSGTASGPAGKRISSWPTSPGYLELATISVASWTYDGSDATRGASQPATTTWTLRQVIGRGPNSRPTTVSVILRDPASTRFEASRTYSCPGP